MNDQLPKFSHDAYDIFCSLSDRETVNYTFTVTNNHLDIEYIAPRRSASDSEDDVPLMQAKSELEDEQEVSEKKRRADETNSEYLFVNTHYTYIRSSSQ